MVNNIRFASKVAAAVAAIALTLAQPAFASVHAGDQLDVTVFNHPELTRKLTVDSHGAISMPLAGTVEVRGLGAKSIASAIASALDPYVISPAVSVELVAQSPSIFVSGPSGGVLKYEPGETLAAAIAALPTVGGSSAGSASASGSGAQVAVLSHSRIDMQHVVVERDGRKFGTYDAIALAARGESGPELQPGDTLSLQNKPIAVRVLGDVKVPGLTYLAKDEPLSDAVDQAGGENLTGATSHVVLQRGTATTSLALGDPAFLAPAHDGDVVTLPTAPRVSVVGLVTRPGPLVLRTDFSLLDALYEAGGPTQWADLSHVSVIHDGTQTAYNVAALQRGNASQNPQLKDGDTVYVAEGHKIDFRGIFQSLLPFSFFLPRH